jgi:hypothetical protein
MGHRTRLPRRAVAATKKTCVFCGVPGRLTEEHVFPNWLRKCGYDGVGLQETNDVIQLRGVFSSKVKIVCASCNNGWMSRLEQEAKPLLIHLFKSFGRSIPLDEAAQLTLARWAFKTAVVCAYVDKKQVDLFPKAHRVEFYENDQPPRQAWVRIGAMGVPSDPSKGEHIAAVEYTTNVETWTDGDRSFSFPVYRATIRLVTVVFCIMGYTSTEMKMKEAMDKDFRTITMPLWPVRRPTIWWPPPAVAWRAQMEVPTLRIWGLP